MATATLTITSLLRGLAAWGGDDAPCGPAGAACCGGGAEGLGADCCSGRTVVAIVVYSVECGKMKHLECESVPVARFMAGP